MGTCGDDCERDWVIGVPGKCNDTTGLCECPPGFDGIDDWRQFNSCHVKVVLRDAIHLAVIIVSAVEMILTVAAIIKVRNPVSVFMSETTVAPVQDDEIDSDLTIVNMRQPKRKAKLEEDMNHRFKARRSQAQIRRIEDATSRAMLLLILFLLFGLGTFAYEVLFIISEPIYRFQNNIYQNGAFTLAASSMLNALWLVTYMWFRSLPSMRNFGPLFGVSENSFFFKYPRFIENVTYLVVFCNTLGVTIYALILPAVIPERLELWNQLILISMFASVVAWLSCMTATCYLLNRIYLRAMVALEGQSKEMERETQENDNVEVMPRKKSFLESSSKAFSSARKTIRLTLVISIVGGCLGAFLLFGMVVIPPLQRNFYLAFTSLAIVAHLGAIFLLYLVVYKAFNLDAL